MKKTLFLVAIAAIIFSSCKKEHSATKVPAKKYKVTFNVANFNQRQAAFALRHNARQLASDTITNLNSYLDVLYLVAYDDIGHAIPFAIRQDSTMSNMGTITDNLPAGNYQIFIVAGKNGLELDNYAQTATSSYGYGGYVWQDTFSDVFPITVGNGDISQNVTLSRTVGKLEVTILDNIPANVKSLTVTINPEIFSVNYDSAEIDFDAPSPSPITFTVAIPASAIGNPNFTIDRIIGNTSLPFGVSITCQDANSLTIDSASVSNVVCQKNMKTILSGHLFSGSASAPQSFTAQIDTAWSSGGTQVGFSLRRH